MARNNNKKEGGLHVINLSTYNRPEITEDKRKEWVAYGTDNNYYQYLIELFTNSATNNAIIGGVSSMIYGKGLDALDSSTKTEEYAAMRSIFSNDCLRKVSLDLKLLGEASFQVTYQDKKVYKAEHFPRQTLRAEKCNEEGQIEAYYYHPDWVNIKPSDKPKRIASFGFGNGKEPEVKIAKRYISGYDYYCPVDYQGGLAYAELESEVSDYLINDVQNGFSGTKVVNFNNGIPDQDQQLSIKNDVMRKLTGSRGEKVIIAFNNNAESKTTIDDVPLNDAPAHYEYLSTECSNKLMVAHRITSPLLLGIRTGNNGLGNNADEIKTASLLFNNVTIRPYQDLLIDCIDDILAFNGISLKLYFKTLQPLEFIDTDNAITDEAREEETGVKLSKDAPSFTDEEGDNMLELLEGELMEDYTLIGKREYSEDNENLETWKDRVIKSDLELAVITSKPSSESYLDKSVYKVRYAFEEKYTSGNSRPFCKQMMRRSNNGVVYRLEDIDKASRNGVNKSFGHKGQGYDLFKFKGGVQCGHFFSERLYKLKKKDGEYVEDKALSSSEEVSSIPKTYKPRPAGHKKAKVAPKDMPNDGHHPNYK
jgi:hypothetical protein